MSVRSNHIVLLTGLNGSGKNYLCSVLAKDRLTSLESSELDSLKQSKMILDLDRFGRIEKTPHDRDRWIVDVSQVTLHPGLIIVGTCDNYDEVLAKVALFRQSTGTPVVIIYSIPSFQLFSQANQAKAKIAREEGNPFAANFQNDAELDREATLGHIQRKLGLLALAITTEFAPQLFTELDSTEASERRFALLARKLYGPLDRFESLFRMMAWLQSLSSIAKLTIVTHLNEKVGAEVITKGWNEDPELYPFEVVPVRSAQKGGQHEI